MLVMGGFNVDIRPTDVTKMMFIVQEKIHRRTIAGTNNNDQVSGEEKKSQARYTALGPRLPGPRTAHACPTLEDPKASLSVLATASPLVRLVLPGGFT